MSKGKKSASCKIVAHKFTVGKNSVSLKKGRSTNVSMSFVNDGYKSLKNSNAKIAKVFRSGNRVRIRAKKKGRAKITIVSKNGITNTISVKVN